MTQPVTPDNGSNGAQEAQQQGNGNGQQDESQQPANGTQSATQGAGTPAPTQRTRNRSTRNAAEHGSLEESLSDIPEEQRRVILSEISKARRQAAGYRETANAADERIRAVEERFTAFQTRAARSEIRALAATNFRDAEDAVVYLDPAGYIDDQGEIDTQQIETDLADLLKRKPHLGRTEDGPRTPRPDLSQGSAGRGAASSDPKAAFGAFLGQRLIKQ